MTMKPGDPAIRIYGCVGGPDTCQRQPGERCITASGNPTTPHVGRWRLGQGYADAWNARQAEVDDLTTQLLTATTERDTARDEIGRVTEMAEQRIGNLQGDLDRALARIAELEQPPPADNGRRVWLHYMPNMPAAIDQAQNYYRNTYMNPAGEGGKWAREGGFTRDGALPIPGTLPKIGWEQVSAETDVARGKAAGGDAFLVNIMGLTGTNWTRLLHLARAAAKDGTFRVIPNLDTSSAASIDTQTPAAIATKMAELFAIGAGERIDGELVVSSFTAEAVGPAWWKALLAAFEAQPGVGKVKLVSVFQNASETNMKAFAPFSWALGIWGSATPGNAAKAPNYAARAHALGCRWMAPVRPQDARHRGSAPGAGGAYAEAENTALWRTMWARAVDDAADLVQVVTWNDYAEGTHVAPSLRIGTVFADLTRLYGDAWRRGHQPTPGAVPRLVLTHRIHGVNTAPTTPGQILSKPTLDGGGTPRDTLGALVFAPAGGTLVLRSGTTTRTVTVPAGVTEHTTPLQTGAQSATFTTPDGTTIDVTSPHTVTDKPTVQDLLYRAINGGR